MGNYIGHVFGIDRVMEYVDNRGPQYVVTGDIRRNEYKVCLFEDSKRAESYAERLREEGHYNVQVWAPEGSVNVRELARSRSDARRQERESTEKLKAGVLRRAEQMEREGGVNESALAREAGVDRMTIRTWLGK